VWIVVTYDVSTESAEGRARLRRVALVCQDYGQRVQKSVFECTVNQAQYERLRNRLLRTIDPKADSLRFYRMQEPRGKWVDEYGINHVIDFTDPLLT
jgi:CRISPR-associated protein Cas2